MLLAFNALDGVNMSCKRSIMSEMVLPMLPPMAFSNSTQSLCSTLLTILENNVVILPLTISKKSSSPSINEVGNNLTGFDTQVSFQYTLPDVAVDPTVSRRDTESTLLGATVVV